MPLLPQCLMPYTSSCLLGEEYLRGVRRGSQLEAIASAGSGEGEASFTHVVTCTLRKHLEGRHRELEARRLRLEGHGVLPYLYALCEAVGGADGGLARLVAHAATHA